MNDGRELVQRFVENREQLSGEELESLLAALRLSPHLAIELRDQLLVDELLAQKFDLTRLHFLLQIEQRLRDESEGFHGIRSDDLVLAQQPVDDCNGVSSNTSKLAPTNRVAGRASRLDGAGRRRSHWPRRLIAFAIAVLLAICGIWIYDDRGEIGVVEMVDGDVELARFDMQRPISKSESIRGKDRLVTLANSQALVRFRDGTAVRIASDTAVTFRTPNVSAPGKRVFVEGGRISADVASQPVGKPMVIESENATVEVLGTSLQFLVAARQTHVTVTEGQVRVSRRSDQQSLVVSKDQFAVVAAESLAVAPVGWPSSRDGLIFLFETNNQPNLVRSISTGMNRSFSLRPRGRAHLNHDCGMVLTGGAFLAEDVDGEILAACRQTNQLSIEATIRPSLAKQEGPARIVTFSTNVLERDFTIGQLGDELIVRIRTPLTGPNGVGGVDMGLPVCKLVAGETHHVIVSYKAGKVVCYLNGRQVFEGKQIRGDFSGWSAQHLLFGDEYAGERNWAGSLEGVAIYNRFMEPEEAARNALQYEHLRQSRPIVPQASVLAELVAKSSIPTTAQVQPHRSALVVCKYRIKQVLEGNIGQSSLLVAQWALLDGQNQPIVNAPIGTEATLLLEPFESNPQMQRYLYSDEFSLEEIGERFLEIRQ